MLSNTHTTLLLLLASCLGLAGVFALLSVWQPERPEASVTGPQAISLLSDAGVPLMGLPNVPHEAVATETSIRPESREPVAVQPTHLSTEEPTAQSAKQHADIESAWVIEDITDTWMDVNLLDATGEVVLDAAGKPQRARKLVREVWFKGRKRPFRCEDRLTNTRFQIAEIYATEGARTITGVRVVTGVLLEGDLGGQYLLEMSCD